MGSLLILSEPVRIEIGIRPAFLAVLSLPLASVSPSRNLRPIGVQTRACGRPGTHHRFLLGCCARKD